MTLNPFKTKFVVTEEQCDKFGLINYEHYITWANEARNKFLEYCCCTMEHFENQGLNLVTVNLNLRCMESCMKDEIIEIETLTDRVNNHSLYLTFIAKNQKMDTIFKIDSELLVLGKNRKPAEFSTVDFAKLKANVAV